MLSWFLRSSSYLQRIMLWFVCLCRAIFMACLHSVGKIRNTEGQREWWDVTNIFIPNHTGKLHCTAVRMILCFVLCSILYWIILSRMPFIGVLDILKHILVIQCWLDLFFQYQLLWHYLTAPVTLKSPCIKPDSGGWTDCFYRLSYERQRDVSASTLLSPYQL